MNNIVSFETAKRLKEDGFPQPEFATWQMWYNQYGATTFLSKKEVAEEGTHVYFFCISVVSGRMDRIIPIHEGAYFAPTATDILRELGERYHLVCVGGKNWIIEREISTSFEDSEYEYITETAPIENHESPAEACALAWLKLNEK